MLRHPLPRKTKATFNPYVVAYYIPRKPQNKIDDKLVLCILASVGLTSLERWGSFIDMLAASRATALTSPIPAVCNVHLDRQRGHSRLQICAFDRYPAQLHLPGKRPHSTTSYSPLRSHSGAFDLFISFTVVCRNSTETERPLQADGHVAVNEP